jgi:hypothetical protein
MSENVYRAYVRGISLAMAGDKSEAYPSLAENTAHALGWHDSKREREMRSNVEVMMKVKDLTAGS